MSAVARLAELGLTLPAVATPLAAYVPTVRTGDLVYTSGQLPSVEGTLIATGKVGADVSVETGAECARVATLNALAAVAAEIGDLDQVARVVKIVVFVAGTPEFTGQPQVGNGASQLIGEIFGNAGQHARSAVGVSSLPIDAPVEVEMIVEVVRRPSIQPL